MINVESCTLESLWNGTLTGEELTQMNRDIERAYGPCEFVFGSFDSVDLKRLSWSWYIDCVWNKRVSCCTEQVASFGC